jgi:2-keto-4-pentenoate hydratase/2-oxohepta-3-ene-1,7-dioic acid hydratase in catechol pathway
MKLVSYLHNGQLRAGALAGEGIYRLSSLFYSCTDDIRATLALGNKRLEAIGALAAAAPGECFYAHPEKGQNTLLAPVPFPGLCIDGPLFRNPRNIFGPGDVPLPAGCMLRADLRVTVAAVIGKGGKNIRAAAAEQHMAGLMIVNAFCSGAFHGTGPYLVTPDELALFKSLEMICKVNGAPVTTSQLALENTFSKLIGNASCITELLPGDLVLGPCLCHDAGLKIGDEVKTAVSGLGSLKNQLVKIPLKHPLTAPI